MALYYMSKYHQIYPQLSQEDIISLNNLSNISEKMEKLSGLLELPPEEIHNRRNLCAEIQEFFRKYYPDCLLLMFGSSINGFAVRNCDLDLLFLPFPEYCNLDFDTTENHPIPEPSSILTGETSKDLLLKFNEFSHLNFIRTVLKQEKTLVKKVTFIPTKSPSLKIHLNKIICDLSASNKLVVVNSELLQFFEKLDVRIKPLVMTLQFWARSLGFIRRHLFSNYSFTLMIIFFLQNVNPPILPSVESLIEKSGFSRMIAGWETAFTTDEQLFSPSKNTDTVGDLLLQFFEYYWNFDFLQNIVSPHTGKSLPISDLKTSQDKRIANFKLAAFNIQDPFKLSSNVCNKGRSTVLFKLSLITAHEMLLDKNEKQFSLLFTPNEYQKVFDLHCIKYMEGWPEIFFINLNCNSVKNLSKTSKDRQVWYAKACQAVLDVLQYGLLIECEVTDRILWGCETSSVYRNNDIETEHMETDQDVPISNENDQTTMKSNSPFDLELLLSIQCVLYSRTWIGRKNITEVTIRKGELEEFPNAALKMEFDISVELLQKNPSLNKNSPLFYLNCECYKHSSPQISHLIIMLKPLTYAKEFYHISVFLASYIPKTVNKILSSE